MLKGKPWTVEEEKQLRKLLEVVVPKGIGLLLLFNYQTIFLALKKP